MEHFGERLKSIRLSTGKTQKDICARLRCLTQCYSSYETGRTEPDLTMLSALADCLDVTTDELLGLDGITPRVLQERTEPEKELPEKFRALSDNNRVRLLGYLDSLSWRSDRH